jgi:tRNA (guanosine-2'-O-)-methyltransferase
MVDNIAPEKIITGLEPFVTPARKKRIDDVIHSRINSIHLAMEAPSDFHNALAAVRSAEALGIYHIHMIAPEGDTTGVNGVSKGSYYWVKIYWYDTLEEFLTYIRAENILLAGAIVNANESISTLPITQPICVIFGNEQRGLSENARENCDHPFKISMYGMVESFNLSVAAAITLYDLTSRKRLELKGEADLNPQQQQELQAKYYLQSVDQRLIKGLFN